MFLQLDIFAEFEVETLESEETENNNAIGCGRGSIERTKLGPFGILVNADDSLSEQTPILFRIHNSTSGDVTTFFCADETRFV